MDSSAINHNITIDDFDSILNYSDQSQWTTSDPSSPTFVSDGAGSPWLRGTYHNTTAKGAQVGFDFTGEPSTCFECFGTPLTAYRTCYLRLRRVWTCLWVLRGRDRQPIHYKWQRVSRSCWGRVPTTLRCI